VIEIEPTELPALQRQVADERAASKRWHDTYPMHGTECCADTGDEPRRPPMTKAERCLLVAIFAASAATVLTGLWQALFR
jgi:hypothetical protein